MICLTATHDSVLIATLVSDLIPTPYLPTEVNCIYQSLPIGWAAGAGAGCDGAAAGAGPPNAFPNKSTDLKCSLRRPFPIMNVEQESHEFRTNIFNEIGIVGDFEFKRFRSGFCAGLFFGYLDKNPEFFGNLFEFWNWKNIKKSSKAGGIRRLLKVSSWKISWPLLRTVIDQFTLFFNSPCNLPKLPTVESV